MRRDLPAPVLVSLLACSVVLLAACAGAGSSDGQRDPAAVLAAYADAVNARDLDAVMALFDVDVTITGHPGDLTPGSPARGLAEARALEALTIQRAGADDAYHASDIDVSGNVMTWSHRFHGNAHTCVGTDEIVVESGQIVRWDYSPVECD